VAELLDLAFAESPDGAGEQTGDLGAEGRGDLRGAGEEEVPREDRPEVPPACVHRLDPATRRRLVHHVVVVQRPEVHKLAGDRALHDGIGDRGVGPDLGGGDADDRADPLPAGSQEVGGELGEVRVGGDDRGTQRVLDTGTVRGHAGDLEERGGRHRGHRAPPPGYVSERVRGRLAESGRRGHRSGRQ